MNIDRVSDLPEWNDKRFSFDEEENEGEAWKPKPTREACKALYLQWQQVVFVLKGVIGPFLEKDDDEKDELYLKDTSQHLFTDAHVVGAKIRSSEAGGIYTIRMENAAIIRQLAQGIATTLLLFLEEDSVDESYIMVVRAEIDKFRNLFMKWVNTFEKDEFTDEWGLFV